MDNSQISEKSFQKSPFAQMYIAGPLQDEKVHIVAFSLYKY